MPDLRVRSFVRSFMYASRSTRAGFIRQVQALSPLKIRTAETQKGDNHTSLQMGRSTQRQHLWADLRSDKTARNSSNVTFLGARAPPNRKTAPSEILAYHYQLNRVT